MAGAGGTERYAARRDERVTYVLRAPESRHRFGISALALGPEELYTGGRDGTVRAWALPRVADGDVAVIQGAAKTFDEHVDWVNDVLLVHGCRRLVTCSSDTTVKVWNAAEPRRSLRTLAEHTDYVKALANVPANGVASGSLDGRVLIWDLTTGRLRQECGAESDDNAVNSSVYCLSGSAEANILVAGSTDKTISVWDIRSGEKVVRLRGHSDSVRCLALKHDATLMLSGGSDSTVKLWDLRQERCVRSFDSYADGSVWAVAADRQFDSFVSGCRDGTVWQTNLAGDIASLVVAVADTDKRSNMVLDLALTPDRSGVWVSTTGSTVRLWPLPAPVSEPVQSSSQMDVDIATDTGSDAHNTTRHTLGMQRLPLCRIPGLPGIVAYKIMNDRRHVMTRDTTNEYAIWDITRGVLENSLGVIEGLDIEEVAKEHDCEVSVPSWFQVDIRLGSLAIRLDRSSASNAEIYAVDAGLNADSEDVKVNIGEHVLRALFKTWLAEYKKKVVTGSTTDDENGPDEQARMGQPSPQRVALQRIAELPQYEIPGHVPVVITEEPSPVPILRRQTGAFTGDEEEMLPAWVVDLVRDGKGHGREVVKLSFTLEPMDGSKLPNLSTTNLNAPRVLRVRKVGAYIVKDLREQNANSEYEVEDLEILCNNRVVPPTMSLATVRQFRWRSPEDLHLRFRIKA